MVTDEEYAPVLSTTEDNIDNGECTEGLLGTEFDTDRAGHGGLGSTTARGLSSLRDSRACTARKPNGEAREYLTKIDEARGVGTVHGDKVDMSFDNESVHHNNQN